MLCRGYGGEVRLFHVAPTILAFLQVPSLVTGRRNKRAVFCNHLGSTAHGIFLRGLYQEILLCQKFSTP
eukprot:3706685-Pyramimonas_sp.AAC.1